MHIQCRCKVQSQCLNHNQCLQAEQGLANVALHVTKLQREVLQQQSELQAAQRHQRVEAALSGQMPRLQKWQSMQVSDQSQSYVV